jgi:hypothetical protein
MNSLGNGTYANGAATQINSRKNRGKTGNVLNAIENAMLRPLPTALFIAKGCWNVLVGVMIVAFVIFIGIYRLLFIIGVNAVAFKSWLLPSKFARKIKSQRRPR